MRLTEFFGRQKQEEHYDAVDSRMFLKKSKLGIVAWNKSKKTLDDLERIAEHYGLEPEQLRKAIRFHEKYFREHPELSEEFASQAQRGYFYHKAETSPKWKRMAKEFEDSTPKGKKLPYHVKNAAPNDNLAGHFLKTKEMPVTTANALVNLVFAVADGMPKEKRKDFMKMIQDRIEMRANPFGREKMMPGQEPYTDDERRKRDELVGGAADEDEGDDAAGDYPGEMGEITGRLKAKNMMPAKSGRSHAKNCRCNMCRNMITQDFGVGPGGGSSDSSGFGL